MEISRSEFFVFDFDEHASLISFVWTEKSAAMTVDDYKNAIREYARLVLEYRVRRGLVDLQKFRYRVEDADGTGSWWANEIVPLYNQAGLEKFAFLLPEGEQAPPEETPAEAGAGEKFVTKQFGSEQAAISAGRVPRRSPWRPGPPGPRRARARPRLPPVTTIVLSLRLIGLLPCLVSAEPY
jgi:hypothetical protein